MTGGHEHDHEDQLHGGIKPLTATDPPRIGPYVLLGRLGAGGMGRVYLARSEGGRTVAVKVVHAEHVADPQFRARFRREVDAARRVGERYTAPVLDAEPDAESPWIATGYVPGLSLEQVVRGHGPLPTASVLTLADGLLHALKDIHDAGIVHRDLKPSNVMLTVEGPKVIDFGIARAVGTSVESLLTSTGMVIGSPGFMAPEQIRGETAGPKSDVFTLGCVLTYAATGVLPFGDGVSNQHAVMYHIVEAEPDLARVRDEGLRTLIGRLLAKRPADRPSVDDLLAEPGRETAAESWLPAAVVGHLARRSARLLDAEAAPIRQEADRATVGLRGQEEETPEADSPAEEGGPKAVRKRRRRVIVAVPLVVVLAGGGGTVVMLQPFGGGGAHASPPATASASPSAPGSPSPAGSASPAGERSPAASRSKDKAGDGGKDGREGDGGSAASGGSGSGSGGASGGGATGATGEGSPGGTSSGGTASDSTAGSTRGSGDTGSGSSAGGSSAGGSSAGSTGSGTSGSAGGSGGGSTVPASFVGTWKLGETYNTGQPGTITISGGGAVRLSDYPYNPCPYEAEVTSTSNGGSRIDISAPRLIGANPGYCHMALEASNFTLNGSGIEHNVSGGVGYYYKRA
ncbi:serine/threonine-protein kinase [Streptomyces sp. OR43]|uniref:serine/threonine-protein kinase n=1 Tax=Streptomyces sp. or43 TaxID=2478957 RepID=UPI0011CDCA86|nr:serine/threonine-protein kinase [Streptomyces sp. or43]TXS38986.1 serine/threonine protein kinase [Streptomyces sp. or43]